MLTLVLRIALLALVLSATGCGSLVAHRLAQAPNTYPDWFAPAAPVLLDFEAGFLTNFPASYAAVGPPAARLRYRVVPPRDYRLSATATNWTEGHKTRFRFSFKASFPGVPGPWTAAPRGTVVLLHGFGLDQAVMAPWAIRLAEDGWRCVLVDLRGHGESTGKRIFYGSVEARDLSQLLDVLGQDGPVARPVVAFGESYGAALALRWRGVDPRVTEVVAIAPYAELAPAAQNIRREYAAWFPAAWLRAGLKRLPAVLAVPAEELDTTTVLRRTPVAALFVAGGRDRIAPPAAVETLRALALAESELLLLPQATHEALPYDFEALALPVQTWLGRHAGRPVPAGGG